MFGDVSLHIHRVNHDLDVGDVQPIHQHFYQVTFEKQKALESEVQYMLDNGIAQPSFSSWTSPCLLVKNGMVHIVSVLFTES